MMGKYRPRCPRCHHYPGTVSGGCPCYCHPMGREATIMELDDAKSVSYTPLRAPLRPRRIDLDTTRRMKANLRKWRVGGWT